MALLNIRTNKNKCGKCGKEIKQNNDVNNSNTNFCLKSNSEFCSSCFVKVIEKRIRKHWRELNVDSVQKKNSVQKESKIDLENKNKCAIIVFDDLSEYFLKQIITSPFFEIKKINLININTAKMTTKKTEKNTVFLVLPLTLDDVVSSLLGYYFTGKKNLKHRVNHTLNNKANNKVITNVNTNIITMLEVLSNEEIRRFCELKKIRFAFKTDSINQFITELDTKYPGTKHSLHSTLHQLRKHKLY